MSGLVGYGSSDEDEDELQPEKPAKVGNYTYSTIAHVLQEEGTKEMRMPTHQHTRLHDRWPD